jgi:aryl-alcohol dehydrogenase-like predicted oxidoreductase
MDYVNIGQTGLKVSRICLGMMTNGTSQWRPWVLDEADAPQQLWRRRGATKTG